ncbi:response regulator [Nostoc sp. FACHB-152]|uniref:hybrid histidine kinase/response regulator HrmK n=1 Tax=unclassified Nostoc TaxID=2593658 RepID=UPI001687ED7B|nr:MULTISPECIES: hybrid histidine kinase/response regulator HrmK [unclassified Nostoc]MBD2446111.1 response regulator [Nostoc sp. FACHB-152]MBD2467343.1 response regulator [Nostoc sp. FACHB-145]
MQQYSSLPERNSQVDTTPTLLATIQQLRAELWLERSLNKLQNRLHDYLLSAGASTLQVEVIEAEIFQTVVNELDVALNNSRVAIALAQPTSTFAKVCYISASPSPAIEIMPKKGKKLRLKLADTIKIEDLQQLANQEMPSVWPLASDSDTIGWLIIGNASREILTASQLQLKSELLTRVAQYCVEALVRLEQIKSWHQQSQYLGSSNQELQRTNQLKNQFLANTSHEIRTPLSSIIGFTHLLLAQGYDPSRERHQEYLNIIQSSGKHLLALINDILDLSKIEANQLEVQYEEVDVPELCRNVLALIKEKAANKGLKLCLELDPTVKTLVADPLRLKQMLLNLLFNAVKFTPSGSVGLQVLVQGTFLRFTVWDTGIGISQADQTQIFKPYVQIANSVTTREEGTGLGLVVTRKLAEMHGGSVTVESEANCGSRFSLILPVKQVTEVEGIEGDSTRDITPSSHLPITSSCNSSILLVEDDLPNGKLMQTYLERFGYHVTWIKNASQMWEALSQKKPGLILIDIKLPDENGLKLVQQIRQQPEYQMIPIIAQTAMAMKGDRETCLASGANEYISKPLDLPLLANLVGKYIKLPQQDKTTSS